MVPENRLETMLKQAIEMQVVNCFYHDNRNTSSTLYSDHKCEKYVHSGQAVSTFFMTIVFDACAYNGADICSSSQVWNPYRITPSVGEPHQ